MLKADGSGLGSIVNKGGMCLWGCVSNEVIKGLAASLSCWGQVRELPVGVS